MDYVARYFDMLWAYLLVSAPYLLFGFLISGIVNQYLTVNRIKSWLGKSNISSVLKASAFGVPLPLCSCSVIPAAVTLRKGGASNAATSSFLISTPESGIDSISLTYALIDLPMAILRPIAAFISASFAGLLQMNFNKFELEEKEEGVKSCCSKPSNCSSQKGKSSKIQEILTYGFIKLVDDLAGWLALGILLGALIELVIPQNFFMDLGHFENRLVILLVGVPLYICASASTPIAASLMLKGLSPGAALLFLLVGPATNISNIAVLQKYIGKKGVFINIISIIFVGLAFSYIADYLYLNFVNLKISSAISEHQHNHSTWWQQISAVILSILILKSLINDFVISRIKHARV